MFRSRINAAMHPETLRMSAADRQRLHARMPSVVIGDRTIWAIAGAALAVSLALTFGVALPFMKWIGSRGPTPWWAAFIIPACAFAPMTGLIIACNKRAPRYIRRGMNDLSYPTCITCGYNRTGIDPQAPCPECGAAPLKAEPTEPQ